MRIPPAAALLLALAWSPASPSNALPAPEPLLEVQQRVQSLVPGLRSTVVTILTGDGTASGVVIDAQGLVLTAAHVAERPGRELSVLLHDGRRVKGTTLGLDTVTDAALMQLHDRDRSWPHATLARRVAEAQSGDWCFALGHPGGYDSARGVVLRVGRIVRRTANALQTDCVLMGGDSGGPLFNLNGEVIGVHSLIYEERDENLHVSMAPFLRSWQALKDGVIIRTWASGSGGFLGLRTDLNARGQVEVLEVLQGSPSAQAGLRAGETILALDGEPITGQPEFTSAIRARAAGEQVRLRLRQGDAEREVVVIVGARPAQLEPASGGRPR